MLRQIPQIINDAWCVYGNDLLLNGVGDLQVANGINLSEQRVIRRLLTNPGDYPFVPAYGAGLPAYVGEPLTPDLYDLIQSTTLSNIFLETSVSQDPAPVVLFQTVQQGILMQINYTVAPLQIPIVINFPVNNV